MTLHPPRKLLLPCLDRDRPHVSTTVGVEVALLTKDEYGACSCVGEHPAVTTWTLRVPCDALPHTACPYCDCGDAHILALSDADVANLREMLAMERTTP